MAFGRPFIGNPDLPRRFAEGLPLVSPDGDTLFGGDAWGYVDYPSYGNSEVRACAVTAVVFLHHLNAWSGIGLGDSTPITVMDAVGARP